MDSNVYVVKQRWLSGRGKKMWESGDTVKPSDFPENFDQLISEGRIEVKNETIEIQLEVSGLEKVTESIGNLKNAIDGIDVVTKEEIQSIDTSLKSIVIDRDGELVTISDIADVTKNELMPYLSKKEIDFNPLDKKAVLWGLAINN